MANRLLHTIVLALSFLSIESMATMPRGFKCQDLLSGAMEVSVGDVLEFSVLKHANPSAMSEVRQVLERENIEILDTTDEYEDIGYYVVRIGNLNQLKVLGNTPQIHRIFYSDAHSKVDGLASKNEVLDPTDILASVTGSENRTRLAVIRRLQQAGIHGIDQLPPTATVELVFILSQNGRGARDLTADSVTGMFFDGWHQIAAHYKPLKDQVGFLKLVAHLDKHYGRQMVRLQREFSLVLNPRGDNHNQSLTFGSIVVRGELQNIVRAMQATDSSGNPLVPHVSPTDWKPGFEPELLPVPRNRTN